MSRAYVLNRSNGLPPMVFSSMKKAREWCRTRYPFSTEWAKVGPGPEYLKGYPEWRGNNGGSIVSVPVDEQ